MKRCNYHRLLFLASISILFTTACPSPRLVRRGPARGLARDLAYPSDSIPLSFTAKDDETGQEYLWITFQTHDPFSQVVKYYQEVAKKGWDQQSEFTNSSQEEEAAIIILSRRGWMATVLIIREKQAEQTFIIIVYGKEPNLD